jgi:NADH-quinone oxidoreductase subunit L
MSQILQLFVLIPLFYFIISLAFPRKREKLIAQTAITAVSIHLAGIVGFIVYWLINGYPVLDIKHLTVFKGGHIEIFIDFYFDKVTAVYALMGAVITLLVIVFSRYYLHRDDGFKRFFSTVLLFFFAYNMVIFSGNFETLFLGWEILGVCSFLLIAFYRDRYLPVKNGLKVISVYRLGDICLILTMWMSHQLWHENITFFKLNDAALVQSHLQEHNWYGIFICIMIVIAAATKSAQLPFSSWLPRAMEGPTSSSAIFYGSLSVHLGVFLLLRTYPYWESVTFIKALVIGIGLLTSLVAAGIARVQSTVKTQIAYSSIAQIGLIFIEVALGFHVLALIHFAGNAFLRTYQLLVSPSVLSYLIHDMVFNYKPRQQEVRNSFFNKIRNSFYMLSVKEWNLDTFMYRFLWSPFKWVGNKLNFLTGKIAGVILVLFLFGGLYIDLFPENIPGV